MGVMSFRELTVWQKAMDLTIEIYRLVKKLPREELYDLSSQMRRAAVSIPSNIAEGQSRKSSKEFANFLSIAQGSKAELETQLLICNRLNYLTEDDTASTMKLLAEIGKMITAIIPKLTSTSNH